MVEREISRIPKAMKGELLLLLFIYLFIVDNKLKLQKHGKKKKKKKSFFLFSNTLKICMLIKANILVKINKYYIKIKIKNK